MKKSNFGGEKNRKRSYSYLTFHINLLSFLYFIILSSKFSIFLILLLCDLILILGAIHLKTGSIHHLPEQISKIFKNRLNPIITGKLRPKVIVSEDANIIQKSAKIMEIYRPSFERIYNVKRSISACHQKGKFLDLKSFIDIMVESGLLVYEGIEKRKIVWMIMERNQDPEESIFKIILKIVKREGRSHHYLEGNIAKLILQKLQAELSLSQFEHLFVVLFCKMV